MSLSVELISQFAKVTNDNVKTKKDSTIYGTTPYPGENGNWWIRIDDDESIDTGVRVDNSVDWDKEVYVHVDGSYQGKIPKLLKARTTVAVQYDNRVIVSIRNHMAVVTGNLTTPSTTVEHVNHVETTITKKIDADCVTTDKLTAAEGRIGQLVTDQITAQNVVIEGKLDADVAEITYAKIEQVDAHYGEFDTLRSDYAAFKETTTNELYADVAEIEKLIFGSAGGSVIQTSFANAVIAQLGNAQIKSAMIDDIDTNEVTIKSSDGRLVISDETIQISDANRVRVQIGKDALNDYSINVWDENGNLMFSKGGITDAAIKGAIIRDDMVSPTANISAGKIFVSDVDKTLDVAFKEMTTEVTEMGETITSQGAEITALKDSIETRVWQQDINNVRVGGRNLLPDTDFDGESKRHERTESHGTEGGFRFTPTVQVESEVEYTLSAYIRGNANIVFYELNEGGNISHQWIKRDNISATDYQYYTITFTVPSTRVFNMAYICTQYGETATLVGDWFEIAPRSLKLERGNKATDWTPAPEDAEGEITTLSTKYTLLEQDVDSITTTVASHTAQLTENSEEITLVQSTIGQLADSISMLVTDGNGTSLMTQTENGWTFSTSDIQAAVDRTAEALDELVAQCGNTDAAVEVLQQSVSDLGVMAEYIRIGTHEGEPCIELGEGDSNFKLLITNTRIMFMDGSDIPAYINNKSLYIKKAVVEEELHQGGYAWVTRSNGHLSLIWKGVTN